MTMELSGLARWAGLEQVTQDRAEVVVAGIPYDGSAVYRKGAALAPDAIRVLSASLPPVDERGRSLTGLHLHDLGDLRMADGVEAGWARVADRLAAVPAGAALSVLGGDHCAAIPVLAAQARRHPDLALLWVDAHPDLCDSSRGGRWTCGCALRRGLEVSGIDPAAVVLVGVRDFDPEEIDFIRERGVTMVTAADLDDQPQESLDRIREALAGRSVQVSFDIDALDPAHAPGTEIAVAGGMSTRQALRLIRQIAQGTSLVGFDVFEVAPPLDHADVTVLAALKLLLETWPLLEA
ncbi:MAG TPA: arginase family protein [Candidatus Dormibacteraeota bacterium]|jgi:agmatinase|nr:arginase family protein [Candidatus Dormibacteraeota bacterium]